MIKNRYTFEYVLPESKQPRSSRGFSFTLLFLLLFTIAGLSSYFIGIERIKNEANSLIQGAWESVWEKEVKAPGYPSDDAEEETQVVEIVEPESSISPEQNKQDNKKFFKLESDLQSLEKLISEKESLIEEYKKQQASSNETNKKLTTQLETEKSNNRELESQLKAQKASNQKLTVTLENAIKKADSKHKQYVVISEELKKERASLQSFKKEIKSNKEIAAKESKKEKEAKAKIEIIETVSTPEPKQEKPETIAVEKTSKPANSNTSKVDDIIAAMQGIKKDNNEKAKNTELTSN